MTALTEIQTIGVGMVVGALTGLAWGLIHECIRKNRALKLIKASSDEIRRIRTEAFQAYKQSMCHHADEECDCE